MAANSMYVMNQGQADEATKRPTSGRKSINKIPLKRSGSSLEIIQPNDDGDKKPSNANSGAAIRSTNHSGSRPSSRTSSPNLQNSPGRQSSSAGSAADKKKAATGIKNIRRLEGRSSSAEGTMERCDSPKKQVFLPSVRRNFEQHGMPKDQTLNTMLRESMTSPQEQAAHHSNPSNSDHGNNKPSSRSDIDALMQRLSMKVEGSQIDGELQERKGSGKKKSNKPLDSSSANQVTDAYYISHGDEEQSQSKREIPNELLSKVKVIPKTTSSKDTLPTNKPHPPPPSSAVTDSYYISHGEPSSTETNNNEEEERPGKTQEEEAKEESEESSDDEEDEPKAPFELLGEFLEAVMEEEWEDAEKLCKLVLIYEPDNTEANQFKPLIDEMLRREREHQLFGSDSDEEESSSEGDSDDDDDDDDDDDNDDDDDEDEDDAESTESESDNEPTAQNEKEKEEAKKDRESKMLNAMKNMEPR